MIMTEEDIERRVERMMDHLYRLMLNGDMLERDYDLAVHDLVSWAEHAYEGLRRKGWYD